MGFKSFLAKPYAWEISRRIKQQGRKAIELQEAVLKDLLRQASGTSFGKEHHFAELNGHADFRQAVPLSDYEGHRSYIERIISGQKDVLWKGHPIYFAETAGTTSGAKFIPITSASISNHVDAAKHALLTYITHSGKAGFTDGNMIFLSGSPKLEKHGGILTGRLSGIVNHHIPSYLRANQMPSYDTNCIEDWEEKIERIVDETLNSNMTLISGIPPWVQMYFERLQQRSQKRVGELFKNFSLLVHGGVNFEPYRKGMENLIGRRVDTVETYPASEGFIGWQDGAAEDGLLLNVNSGIFYEFIPAAESGAESPQRLGLKDVRIGENYEIVLTTNAGLWSYRLGDTVRFCSVDPYRLKVSGRVSHFISAFGEHVITEQVEKALQEAVKAMGAEIVEFTLAPQVQAAAGELPHHEWFIEFSKAPDNMDSFCLCCDNALKELNSYYKDLVNGKVLQPLKIRTMQAGAFRSYMKKSGKLGGQNKLARLSNNRDIVDELSSWVDA